jgi:hypothetical protein
MGRETKRDKQHTVVQEQKQGARACVCVYISNLKSQKKRGKKKKESLFSFCHNVSLMGISDTTEHKNTPQRHKNHKRLLSQKKRKRKPHPPPSPFPSKKANRNAPPPPFINPTNQSPLTPQKFGTKHFISTEGKGGVIFLSINKHKTTISAEAQ